MTNRQFYGFAILAWLLAAPGVVFLTYIALLAFFFF